jgi:hypothetical protein
MTLYVIGSFFPALAARDRVKQQPFKSKEQIRHITKVSSIHFAYILRMYKYIEKIVQKSLNLKKLAAKSFCSICCVTVKGTVSRDGYFFEGVKILISTFCVCADGFQDLSKLFTTLYNYQLFICLFEITY